MARPRQDGLLYFSFDTDFFYADQRIKRMHSRYGSDGMIFYIYLLTEIYRNGYYIRWDEESRENAIDDLHLTEGLIEQVMTFLISRSLLYKSTLTGSDTIITSPGIQKRYQEAVRSRKRDVCVDSEIWLLSEEETAAYIKVTGKNNKSCGNNSFRVGNESKSVGNDIKESKGKERKINTERVLQIEKFISAYPKDCNRHLTEAAYANLLMNEKVTENELIACARNYAEYCRILKKQDRYIKNAENFLREFVFEKYIPGQYKKPESGKKSGFNNFPQNNYDFDQLEKELTAN